MRVFKFGGASVKDVTGLENVVSVLRHTGAKDLVIVVSAMGKTTNALEQVVDTYFENSNSTLLTTALEVVRNYHFQIIDQVSLDKKQALFGKIEAFFAEIEAFLTNNQSSDYDQVYDQLVPYGELLSSTILQAVLEQQDFAAQWLDIRTILKTDSNFREAKVNWKLTEKNFKEHINSGGLYLTQGFIGSYKPSLTTTLGREGSDYTAAIIGYCLSAESVTIWKDVPGVLNADPRYFENATLLSAISYNEAIELAFYGASVIHPKTLQPLQQKGIPLYVKPFLNPAAAGTCISERDTIEPYSPCFILKRNEVLIKLSSLDFSFMLEEHLGEVFSLMAEYRVKVDLIQHSAISFSLCVDDKFNTVTKMLCALQNRFKIQVIYGVNLYTIRHFTPEALVKIEVDKEVLVKQVAGNMAQLVVK
ncbi:MAG TPA: aspartate kinase [Leeuwenhoekiella sp.]|nr:aspartate kinase [Leeuwenhoekiella sp.]